MPNPKLINPVPEGELSTRLRSEAGKPAHPPWVAWAALLITGAVAFHPVATTWEANPNYTFGWCVPVLAIYLFAARWNWRPAPEPVLFRRGWWPWLAIWSALFFAFRIAGEADPDWRPGLWALGSLYVMALFVWLWLYGGVGWLRHFAFPVVFLLLGLPWFYGFEQEVVQRLMQVNTRLVTEGLHSLAIPATVAGNVIGLPNGIILGVEEACSGILSLQASLVVGCLLGEIYSLALGRRVLLVFLAIAFALIGNFLRTSFLALVAFYQGQKAMEQWHDSAGLSILVLTVIGSWIACLFLSEESAVPANRRAARPASVQASAARGFALRIVLIALAAELLTQGWFAWKESGLIRHPSWTVTFDRASHFESIPLPEISRQYLRSDAYRGAKWKDPQGTEWTSLWLRYDPKSYNLTLGGHTPDHCLPSVGLKKEEEYPDFFANVNGLVLPVQAQRFSFKNGSMFVFWIVYSTRGDLPSNFDTRYHPAGFSKFWIHLDDVLAGNRGNGFETLEVAAIGPQSYETAKAGYLDQLKKMIVRNPM